MGDSLEQAREAFERQAWTEVYAHLGALDPAILDPADLERLAVAAYLTGRDDDGTRAWEQAHLSWRRLGRPADAARCAFWVGLVLLLGGRTAPGGGWLARATRLVDEGDLDCPARGYLLLPAALERLEAGDPAAATAIADDMERVAGRFGDLDLLTFARLLRGQAAIVAGDTAGGTRLLDEAMVAVSTGEVSAVPAGIVYCAVVEACMDAFDLQRAAQWTDALTGWCDAQPDLVPYRGQCLVHRCQILQARGDWRAAAAAIERARAHLSAPVHPALGAALYQQAELHRVRGELDAADRAYREASRYGRDPGPGFALLQLDRGEPAAAARTIRRMLEESRRHFTRPAVLAAAVEILTATGAVAEAEEAARELSAAAERAPVPLLRAMAGHATGTVLLAGGDPAGALAALRAADGWWRALDMPHDSARTRARIAAAYAATGDLAAAEVELEAARATFEHLGARADLERAALRPRAPQPPTPLSDRECEVLRLVARGWTNRAIGAELVISGHTVARHLQNIFHKLGVSSRAAATAYAYEQGLVAPPGGDGQS